MIDVGSDQNGGIVPLRREPLLATQPFNRVGKPEETPVRVIIYASTLHQIEQHLASDTTKELGGVLLGEVCIWQDHTYIEIQSFLPADTTSHSSVHFTFTVETWVALDQAREERFPDRYMVGWYHSHPRLGVFFSGQDNDVHRVVFNQPWHVALVIDPNAKQVGFFGWVDSRLARLPGYYILEDAAEPAGKPRPKEPPKEAARPSPEVSRPGRQAPARTPPPSTCLLIGAYLLLMGAASWVFVRLESLSRDMEALQRRQAELAAQLVTLLESQRDGAAPGATSPLVLQAPGLTMNVGGKPAASGADVSRGSEADFAWTISNPSASPVTIQTMGLQVIVDGVVRPDLFVLPEDSSVLPARLEPGESIAVQGRLTAAESGLYTVSAVVLTSGATGWQTPPADGSPAVLHFRAAPP
jgi:proteasome lid subunit RPN8/RPN11